MKRREFFAAVLAVPLAGIKGLAPPKKTAKQIWTEMLEWLWNQHWDNVSRCISGGYLHFHHNETLLQQRDIVNPD